MTSTQVIPTADFLDCVLPKGIRYIGFTNGNKGPSGKEIINCSAFEEGKQGVAIGDRHLDQHVYFALASFKQAKIYDEKFGREKSYRKEENVSKLKSIWLDIDFKMYETKEECYAGVRAFLEGARLTEPTFIVNSGGGLHLYWVFEEELTIERWRPLAQGLAALAKRLGLRADYGVTIDAARVLRLPGTVNHKYPDKPRVQVEEMKAYASLDRMSELLTPHAAAFANPTQARITVSPNVVNLFDPATRGDLSEGYESGRDTKFAQIVQHCATLREVVETEGANDNYPKWKDVLHLLAYVTDGRDYIHKVSQGHPTYSPQETEARFEESVIIKAENRRGPTTCARFSSHSIKCSTCKYLGQLTTPWKLGVTVDHGVDADPSYVIGEKTFRNKTVETEEGTTIERVLVVDAAAENWRLEPVLNATEDSHKLLVDLRTKGFRATAEIMPSMLGDMRALKKHMYGRYITWHEADLKGFANVAISWVQKLKREQETRPVDHFGWATDGSFVLGTEQMTPEGTTRPVAAPLDIVRDFGVAGVPDPWRKLAAKLCADPHADYSFILAAGFAAPLMRFGTPLSLALSVYSAHSAAGKSTALKTIQSAFGFPRAMFSLDDTHNYIIQRAGVLRDMPALWDEIRGDNVAKEMTTLLFRLTQGKTKGRLSQSAEARPTFDLNTMLICATNTPIADYINQQVKQTDAGAMRFMEFEMTHRPTADVQEVYDLVGQLERNYGHAGRDYLRFLVRNHAKIEPVLKTVSDAVAAKYDFPAQERFWRDGVVKIVAAAHLLKAAGIMPIDPERVLGFAMEVVKRQRLQLGELKEDNDDLLDVLVHYYANALLVTDRFAVTGPRNVISVKRPPRTSEVHVQVSIQDQALRIAMTSVQDFCEKFKLSTTKTVQELTDRWGAKRVKYTVAGGTQFSRTGQVRALELDLKVVGTDIIQAWEGVS